MALTRTIPIKDRVFSSAAIANILGELSGYYSKGSEPYLTNRYRLDISEDETTTTSIDAPPKSFEPLLTTPIRHLSLRIESYKPNRDVEFTLYHGSDIYHNSLRLHSDDEDWVNSAHAKASKLLAGVELQSRLLQQYGALLTFPLAFVVGWPLKNLLFLIFKLLGLTTQVPWSWTVLSLHLLFAGVLGFLPAAALLSYAAGAYPSVEIQTGPKHFWKEANLRLRLRIILGIVVVAPSANLLYDVYKWILAG